jgi:hypothetical protein
MASRRCVIVGVLLVSGLVVTAPALAQQGATGALGSGSTGLTTPGLNTGRGTNPLGPTSSFTPSSGTPTGSFGSPTGPTLGAIGSFSGTTLGQPSPSSPTSPRSPLIPSGTATTPPPLLSPR